MIYFLQKEKNEWWTRKIESKWILHARYMTIIVNLYFEIMAPLYVNIESRNSWYEFKSG